MKNKLKKFLFHFLTYFLLFIVTILLLEIPLHMSGMFYKRLRYAFFDPPIYTDSQIRPWDLKPNMTDVLIRPGEFSTTVNINSQGLREDREIEVPKPKNVYRIGIIGDSFAFGFGVDMEDSVHKKLEKLLNERLRSNDLHFEVVNFGYASGYSPDSAYTFVNTRLKEFKPDFVLHFFCYSNDIGNVLQNVPFSKYDKKGLPVEVQHFPIMANAAGFRVLRLAEEFVRSAADVDPDVRSNFDQTPAKYEVDPWQWKELRFFRVLKLIYKRWQVKQDASLAESNIYSLPTSPNRLSELYLDSILKPGDPHDGFLSGSWKYGWEITGKSMKGSNDLIKSWGAKYAVMLVPENFIVDYDPTEGKKSKYAVWFEKEDMDEAIRLYKPGRIFGNFFDKNQMLWVDPTEAMRTARNGNDLYFEYDAHWNIRGNEVLAGVLFDWLEKQKLFKPGQ